MTGSFLQEPPVSAQVQVLYDEDLADGGYVWNVSRLWAHQPDTLKRLFELMSQAFTPSGLTFRQRGILVTAAASTLGESYCSLAWGGKLGQASDAAVAAGVLNGSDAGLTDQEKTMAAWARKVAQDPNATTPADLQALRESGPVLPGQVADEEPGELPPGAGLRLDPLPAGGQFRRRPGRRQRAHRAHRSQRHAQPAQPRHQPGLLKLSRSAEPVLRPLVHPDRAQQAQLLIQPQRLAGKPGRTGKRPAGHQLHPPLLTPGGPPGWHKAQPGPKGEVKSGRS